MDPSMDDPMSEEEEEDDDYLPPGDSGSSSKGVVVEGVEIAEEDVYAYGDPDDPLDRVLDVYLADELEDHLYLLQYPMRPADRPSTTPLAVKVKAANHLLEVEHAIKQGGKHFDKHAPAQLRQATQTHTGSRVRPATNFAFGVIRRDEFHLTPVHATMQMRPCFQHIDKAKALEIEVDLDDPDNGGAKTAERPQQVSFKKKETERATAARKSSYAYKKSIEDAEPWVALEVHGQNDERSLDEFARMFVDTEDDDGGGTKRSTSAKEFPPCERYLQGLDYMEEYDENGESFSAGGRGRSLDDSIDLVTTGTSAPSSGNTPSTPVQQLGGDAKIVGYLKLAHLVPFAVLLDVTKMSPDTVMQALSVEGRQRGLLLRGNWAARSTDVWGRGPPHAANCLSVVQCLLHRYGAVSRPDLQRRFPELDPLTLKEVISRVADLDTIHRRWVPKLKDGITFGMEHPDVVELEEERWALQESSLKELLGEEILAPPSCPTFEPFVKVLAAAAKAAVVASASAAGSRASASRALPSFGVLRLGEDTARHQRPEAAAAAGASTTGSGGEGSDDKKVIPKVEGVASKGKAKAGQLSAAAAAVGGPETGGSAPAPAPRRHFKPKKKPAKTAAGPAAPAASTTTVTAAGIAGKDTAIKQEHEGGTGGDGGGGSGGAAAGAGVEETLDTAVVAMEGAGGDVAEEGGGGRGRRGTGRPRRGAAGAGAAGAASGGGDGGDQDDDVVVAGNNKSASSTGPTEKRVEARGRAAAASGSALPAAKEEPRESSGGGGGGGGADSKSLDEGGAAVDGGDGGAVKEEGKEGGAAPAAEAAAEAAVVGWEKGGAEEEGDGKAKKKPTVGKARGGGGGSSGKEKAEPVGRPKVKPRATRAKKGKGR